MIPVQERVPLLDDLRSLVQNALAAIRREPLAPLALLTLLAAAIRAFFLDMPMRLDEATTFNEFVLQPWRITIGKYLATNNHPLHSILAKLCVDLLGSEPWVVRIPAFVAGVLLVPVSYLVATRMFSPAAAWFAALGVTILPTFVLFSTNARGYTMVAVFVLLQWLALRDGLQRGRATSWILVALLGAVGVYTHLTMAFAYAGNVAWALLWMARHRDVAMQRLWPLLWSGVASVAIAIVLYLPFVYFSGVDALIGSDNVSAQSATDFLERSSELLRRVGDSWTTGLPTWMAIAVGLLAAIALVAGLLAKEAGTPVKLLWTREGDMRHRSTSVDGALPFVAVATFALLLGSTLRVPPPRSTLYLLPLILAAFGALVARFAARLPRLPSLVVWGVAAIPLAAVATGHVTKQPVRRMSETGWMPEAIPIFEHLQTVIKPGDAIASHFLPRDILRFYFLRAGKDRAPLVPGVCPKPPNTLYLVVRRSESLAYVLTYNKLPLSVKETATRLGSYSRYSLWRADVPEGMQCPRRGAAGRAARDLPNAPATRRG